MCVLRTDDAGRGDGTPPPLVIIIRAQSRRRGNPPAVQNELLTSQFPDTALKC